MQNVITITTIVRFLFANLYQYIELIYFQYFLYSRYVSMYFVYKLFYCMFQIYLFNDSADWWDFLIGAASLFPSTGFYHVTKKFLDCNFLKTFLYISLFVKKKLIETIVDLKHRKFWPYY